MSLHGTWRPSVGPQPGSQVPYSWQPSDLGGPGGSNSIVECGNLVSSSRSDVCSLMFSPLLWLKAGNNILPSFLGAHEGQISQCIQKYFKEVLYKYGKDCARSWGQKSQAVVAAHRAGWVWQGERSSPKELRGLVPGLGTGEEGEGREVAQHRTEGDSKLPRPQDRDTKPAKLNGEREIKV